MTSLTELIGWVTVPRVLVDLLSYTGTKGGMETYTRELYRRLGAMSGDYEYIGFVNNEAESLDMTWFPGELVESRIRGENRFAWAWGELLRVGREARRLDADLVHAPATLGPARTSMPTVITMHDMLYWSHPEFMSTPLYTAPVKWMERLAARNAERIITISPDAAEQITKYLGVRSERLDVVPLAGTPPTGVDRMRAGSEGPMILAMGNRRPHKNWGALIHALAILPADRRPRVVITGGRGDDPLAELATNLGVADSVDLRGWVSEEEVTHLYSVATALAIPSRAEGFSLPTLEAMASGLPTLLSDIAVHHYVGGDAALYFDPDDHETIARLMRLVSEDPDLCLRLSRAGVDRASEFSWDRTAKATREAFETALRVS